MGKEQQGSAPCVTHKAEFVQDLVVRQCVALVRARVESNCWSMVR
jgi:hypothetical protein